ncbi:MOSC domain-containing protein [Devosia sp. XGJD_8]|jgi:MOSC domain-containing protein YiiM|uniref:MOSC domain-containing protein n=1 Tax=Devosia sp. XGJD_8 TaxID=3391187 RepID=UPI003984BBC0
MAILLSVNRGKPEPIPAKSAVTGIFKRPVEGPVEIDAQGLKDDAIIDRRHHGGVDQAVYLYFGDDYEWWSGELGETIAPGTFGENLTIGGVAGRQVSVGDRFTIGNVVLEVTSHRTPCMVFAARMGDPGWVRRFHRAGRPGAYCRVIEPGSVEAGKPVKYQLFEGERTSVAELMAQDGVREIDPEFMRRALTAPVHYKMRADYQNRLARLF